MTTQDEHLLECAAAGDRDALAALLQHHGPAVRERLRGRIRHVWQSVLSEDDVMQVTYLEAFLHIRRFQPGSRSAFASWLHRIARNNLLSAIRGLSRAKRPDPRRQLAHQAPGGTDTQTTLLQKLIDTGTTPSVACQRAETLQALEVAIAALPPDYRLVVQRFDLQECPVAEIAAEMGRTEGAVYMLRARAHDRLRSALGAGETRGP